MYFPWDSPRQKIITHLPYLKDIGDKTKYTQTHPQGVKRQTLPTPTHIVPQQGDNLS